jgi:hypothetical protein
MWTVNDADTWALPPPPAADMWAMRACVAHAVWAPSTSRFERSPHGSTPLLPSLRPHRFLLSSRHLHSRKHRHRFHFTLYPLLPCVLCAGGAVATAHAPLSPSVLSPSRVLTLCLSYYLFLCFLLLPRWQNFSESVDPAIIYRKCQDMFALRANLMNDNIFLPRSLRLGFLFFVFLRSLFFLLFLFCFCCRLVDSLVQNPLLMPDLFSLCADLMNGDIFFVLSLLPSFHFFSFTLSCCKFHSCRWARALTLGLFFVLSLLAFLFYFLLPPHWLLGA